jgi:hypothetical protein
MLLANRWLKRIAQHYGGAQVSTLFTSYMLFILLVMIVIVIIEGNDDGGAA